jgi:hypothetical protein
MEHAAWQDCICVQTADELITRLTEPAHWRDEAGHWVFRGQGLAGWHLEPTAYRSDPAQTDPFRALVPREIYQADDKFANEWHAIVRSAQEVVRVRRVCTVPARAARGFWLTRGSERSTQLRDEDEEACESRKR